MTLQPCSITRSALLILAITLGAPSTSAQEAPRIAVDLAGVDLATPGGLDVARHRIDSAARAVCAPVVDLNGWHMQKSACVHTARNGANRQLTQMRDLALARRAVARLSVTP